MSLPRALLFSLFAHGVLFTLWWVPATLEHGGSQPPLIQASLASPVPAPAAVRQPQPALTQPSRPQITADAKQPATPAMVSAGGKLGENTPQSDVVKPTVAVTESPRPAESAPVESPRAGVSAEGLRQYRFALAREARRHRQYPPLARSRGWEGVAEVRVEVNPGQHPAVALSRSSGHELLDTQALEMMKLAIVSAILPDTLRGYSFSVPVPISFSLED